MTKRLLRGALVALALSMAGTSAWSQGAVQQVGPVYAGEAATWVANGLLTGGTGSGGGSQTGPITPSQVTVSNNALGVCQNGVGGTPSLCSGFVGSTPTITTPSSSLVISIGGVNYTLPAAFNSGGGGYTPGTPLVTTALTVNNAGLGISMISGTGPTFNAGFVGGVPTLSTSSSALNLSIGGVVYSLPAAFGTGGGTSCATCLPLTGGTLTGSLTLNVGAKLLDNTNLTLSSDGTVLFGFQSSPDAVVLQNAPLQANAGFWLPAGQNLVFNSASGTAFVGYDNTLNRVRFQNIPVQIDQSLYVPGGNIIASGLVAAGNGFLVTGSYNGYTAPALNFSTATFTNSAPAIILGDTNTISFNTAATGFQLGSVAGSPTKWQLSFNGTPIFSVDSNGNLACAGTGCSSSAAQTFTNLTVTGSTTLGTTVAGALGASSLTVIGAGSIGSTLSVTGNTTVGGTLAVTGAATLSSTLGVTGAITPSQTAGIVGTTAINNATAGSVGEYVSSSIVAGSAVSLTTATAADITSVSLTAGDWQCHANAWFTAGTSTAVSALAAWINSTSATAPTAPGAGADIQPIAPASSVTGTLGGFDVGSIRFQNAATTTLYLSTKDSFATSTLGAYGFIGCRRMR